MKMFEKWPIDFVQTATRRALDHDCHEAEAGEARRAQLRQNSILRLNYKTYYGEQKEVVRASRDKCHFHAKPWGEPVT